MLKTVLAACALLCAFVTVSDARPLQRCAWTSDLMRPTCVALPNFLAGVKSIKVTMKRVKSAEVVGGRPAKCHGIPWCGCWLRLYLGIAGARLNLARAWQRVGSAAPGPAPGVIAVWRHHVGKITAVAGNQILLLSGNDGHAVRQRWRSTLGIIAYRLVS